MSFGDVYSTTINVNGKTVFSSRYSPCCGSMFMRSPMMSCFGYGFGGFGYGGFGCWPGSFGAGLGAGVGFAAGAALVPAMPAIFNGIGKGLSWVGTNVIAPAAKGVWNGIKWVGTDVIAPAAKGVWNGIKWVGKTIGKGISSIFHKKSKTKTEEVTE